MFMKRILEKLKKSHREFLQYAENNHVSIGTFRYIQFVFYYKKYSVSMSDYFSNRLYDRSVSHVDFWKSNHRVIHKWRNVINNYKPANNLSQIICRLFSNQHFIFLR